ncbi:uracil-DNA glycosylase, family 4 [Legionella oakridgensis ATCC 33761 = DSM 21215]|uniref:Type-4 uracil-DNA glycosylase n=2 Tax=Legionella oakridgensis TaxID=29423 RepID=W0BFY0_9GAMM|nr:uracil-DNA glycosylase, family 4 [Legionella oakridgensis ATCC 33761 = DSM 21215]
MQNSLRQYYLQQMGIETWILRQPNSGSQALCSLAVEVKSCTQCVLHKTRTQTVFARGNPKAKLMIIGEAPGFHEDKQGLPFVGKAGNLLNKMLHSIGLSDEDVYIANVIKCRPPDNRDPKTEE